MRDKTREMFDDLESFLNKKKKDKFAARIFTREDTLDTVQAEITKFLTEVLSGTLSLEQTEQAKKQLLLADEYESVSDYVMQVLKYYMRLDEHGLSLSEDQKNEIASIHVMLLSFFDKVHASQDDLEVLHSEAMQLNSEVTVAIKALRNKHLDRISTEKMPPLLSTSYNDIINGYRKIKNILVHVLETRSGSSAEK
jgi:phosphate:Na+ symporter